MPIDYAPKTPWPPKPYDTADKAMAAWNDWWVGDVERLAGRYRGSVDVRGSWDRNGGLTGSVKRFFWGRPTPAGQSRVRLHMPLPADLTRTSADLLFGSAFTPVVGEGNSKQQNRLAKLLGDDITLSTLANAAEAQSVLGGTYLRAVWDTELRDRPWIAPVDADAAIPTWRWGVLQAVTFWQKVREEDHEVWRFLERYEPGRIYYALYKGTLDDIGIQMPLEEHEASRWAAPLVDETGGIDTGSALLAAAYVPNVTPNPTWRTERDLTHLGRSDFDQLEPWFDALDETYTSLMRDIRLAKARVFVDPAMTTSHGPGQGASFDVDQELFTTTPSGGLGPAREGDPLRAHQFNIRVEEHVQTVRELVGVVIRRAGYSAASFGDDQISVQMTATQVKARQDLSKLTRNKKINHWKRALSHMGRVLLEIDGVLFAGKGGGATSEEITINFPTEANPDIAVLAGTAQLVHAAEAASLQTRVRMIHPNWTSDQVNEEVERIQTESRLADPARFRPGVDGP